MRLGVLGGSFDPIHLGHLLLAESCLEQCRLDEVCFIPAAVPPHKLAQTLASGTDRLQMLKLAIGGNPRFTSSEIELKREGVSYTVETLKQLKDEDPTRELFFLMGADSLADLCNWKNPAEICQLAIPVVVRRLGAPEVDLSLLAGYVSPERLAEIRNYTVTMPAIELESREIRQRVDQQQSIRYRVPAAVERYIETHQLYRSVIEGDKPTEQSIYGVV